MPRHPYTGVKIQVLPIASTPTGSEQDTGWDLPASGYVLDVFVKVDTAEATGGTKTIDVGLKASESGGDIDGFLDGVSVAATGLKIGDFAFTTGSNEVFAAAATLGALLRTSFVAGTDAAGDVGTFNKRPHALNGTAKSVVYQAGSNDWAEFRGEIIIHYIEIS